MPAQKIPSSKARKKFTIRTLTALIQPSDVDTLATLSDEINAQAILEEIDVTEWWYIPFGR